VVPMIRTIMWEALGVFGISLAMAYVGLVIMGFATEGRRYQSGLDMRRPAYSATRSLIGLGVRFVTSLARMTGFILAFLFEGAAQVGDWFTERSNPETRARYRSRFI